MAIGLVTLPVYATSLEDQIEQFSQQAASQEQEAARLRLQADTLANKLASINAQAAQIQTQISLNQVKSQKLTADIAASKKELDRKKGILGENIRLIYKQATVSPLEILASSRSFSDFVDRQQYLDRIKEHIQDSANAIIQLKDELEKQQDEVKNLIRQQSDLAASLQIQRNEAAGILAQTRGDEARYSEQAKASSARVQELKAEQAAILAAKFGGSVSGGAACGGGYPGKWCNVPRDSVVDNWGMYNRECVSYTAFRVAASGRYMPYWGGRGNANQWPGNARAAGIPVDNKPKRGDVAVTMAGPYGHVMYVEAVLGDGRIRVSQYNYGNAGEYSEMTIYAAGLEFIHF